MSERTPEAIERDIVATRERLAGTVDQIATRVAPANIVRRLQDSARDKVVYPSGQLRVERVATIAAVVLTLAGLIVWRRSQ
jgi:hypothetical protein